MLDSQKHRLGSISQPSPCGALQSVRNMGEEKPCVADGVFEWLGLSAQQNFGLLRHGGAKELPTCTEVCNRNGLMGGVNAQVNAYRPIIAAHLPLIR